MQLDPQIDINQRIFSKLLKKTSFSYQKRAGLVPIDIPNRGDSVASTASGSISLTTTANNVPGPRHPTGYPLVT